MKSLVLIIGIIKVIMILCADCTKRVMAFPTPTTQTATPLSPRQLHEIALQLVNDSRDICQRFERERLEGDVPTGQRCQDRTPSVTALPVIRIFQMSKQSILETLKLNLLRFMEPLHNMTVKEMSWPGVHTFYMPANGQRGFEDLEDDVTVLFNNARARIKLGGSPAGTATNIVSQVTYAPASTTAVDTDRANHELLRTLVTFSRQVRSLTTIFIRRS